MKWAVEIQKTGLNKWNLSDLLSGLGFEFVEGIEYPALASPEIEACSTAADAYEKAKKVREAFIGPAQIDSDFELGSVIDYSTDPPRRHFFQELESCVMMLTAGTPTITISPPNGLSPDELEKWKADHEEQQYQAKLERQRIRLEPAYFSKTAEKVLKLLSVEKQSGENLYKIYELMEGNPKKRPSFLKRFGVTKDQFNRFKDAVHNPSVTGDWARHAYHSKLGTPNPMTEGEAETFVRMIAEKWLQSLRASSGGKNV